MQKLLYLLAAACVFLMNTQHSIRIPAGKQVINLGIVDIVIWITFGLWVASTIARRKVFRIQLPPVAFFALPVIAALSLLWTPSNGLASAGKEILQLAEYCIVAALLFINVGENETKLRALVSVFLLAITVVVLWGFIDYVLFENAFIAGGAYANINALGAYFALALPFAMGIALFDDLKPWARASLIVPVVIGAAIILSGAALAATLAALLLVLALRSVKLLPVGLAAVLLGIAFLPGLMRPNHARIVTNSVAVYLDNNHLLSQEALLGRARALYDEERYFDARRVLLLIDKEDKLTDEGERLLDDVDAKLAGRERPPSALPDNRPVVAVRYKRWQAALKALSKNFWGYGLGTFQKTVGGFYGAIPAFAYGTDEPEAFNMGIDQPDTFNRFLITTVELGIPGLAALLWLYLSALGGSVKLFGAARSGLGRGVAAGVTASLAFMPIVAAYSDFLVRGIALPFIFIICCVVILAKEEARLV